jgi:hydroxymethylpyrimidine pyrophosphatase-like HAD family hydrolase
MRVSVRGEFRTERMREMTKKTFHNMQPWFHLMPYEEMEHGNWYKLGWDGTPEELSRVRAALTPVMGDHCILQLGHQTILEVQSCRATKGAMLSALKRLTGREHATLWAIGDYENDYLMMTMADRCAMPANGIDKLREIPGVVTVCHHDEGAIAGLIRHIETELTEAQ